MTPQRPTPSLQTGACAFHRGSRPWLPPAALVLAMLLPTLSDAAPTMVGTPPGQPPVFTVRPANNVPAAPTLDSAAALRDSQAAVGRQLADHVLLDRQGRPVRLAKYRGKPLLVSFIYTGCFQVCPTSTRSLQASLGTLYKMFGAQHFNVVSIGFNQPADSPQAMRAFAAQHGIDEPNWDFLSPPPATVGALTRDFGFSYLATPSGFDHVLGVSVVDAEGRVYTQVYGERMTPDQLGEPLRQLLRGAPMPQRRLLPDLIERVRIICTVYDPETGTYRYDYGLILEIAGGVTFLLAMVFFFINEARNRMRARRKDAAQARPARPAAGVSH
jgi:protein SCO1/2